MKRPTYIVIDIRCHHCQTYTYPTDKKNGLLTFLCAECGQSTKYYKFPNICSSIPRSHIFIHESNLTGIIGYLADFQKKYNKIDLLTFAKALMPNLQQEIELLIKLNGI
jgi:hypothetical protein